MIFKKDEITHLKLFYLRTAIDSSSAVVWIYWIVYLLDQGFSYSIIGLALALNGLSMTIFEVPTGALADATSRKKSVILGEIGFALIVLIIPSIHNPFLLTGVFILWGFPISLTSGAIEAWVVDNLQYEQREDLIQEFYVKMMSIRSVGFIIASILSGVIVHVAGMDMLWYVYGSVLLGSVVLLVKQDEHHEKKSVQFRENFLETYKNIKNGAQFTLKTKSVFYLMIASFFITIGFEIVLICSKPYLEFMGFPREYLGYLSAIGAALSVGMPFIARYGTTLFRKTQTYFSLHATIFSIILISVFFTRNPFLVAFIFVALTLRDTSLSPVIDPFFQKLIPTPLRATIGSFRNMVLSAAILVGDFVIALMGDVAGPHLMLVFGGFIILPSIMFYMGITEKQDR
ncbi:MAG: MFS transporter [Theionarchaea archaeon]|nr:MFS transporter [Theionarchaea archaeon]